MNRFGYTLAILASSVLASACTDDARRRPNNTPPPGSTVRRRRHDLRPRQRAASRPWELLDRLAEGRPAAATRRTCTAARRSATRPSATCSRSLGVNVGERDGAVGRRPLQRRLQRARRSELREPHPREHRHHDLGCLARVRHLRGRGATRSSPAFTASARWRAARRASCSTRATPAAPTASPASSARPRRRVTSTSAT